MKIFRPIWAEIDCDGIEHNFKLIKERLKKNTGIMAVVKADAYGHGAIAAAKSLVHAGANSFAVASLEEANELRQSGIKKAILVLGYTQPNWASAVVEGGFEQTIYHLNLAKAISNEAIKQKKTIDVHVKIDTGMHRIGVEAESSVHLINEIRKLEGLRLKGVYTHFSCADEDDREYTEYQIKRFGILLKNLKSEKIEVSTVHAANSAAALKYPETHFDSVRPGILLYGLAPSVPMRKTIEDFRPVMSVKSTVVELKTVNPGARISYGGTFVAKNKRRIATLPAGYADGFSRKLSNRGDVLIGGVRCPIVGNVCMDFLMTDVSDVPNIRVGDDAVLIGRQGNEEIKVDDIADIIGTINYEVVTLIGKRVKRVFTNYIAGNPNDI